MSLSTCTIYYPGLLGPDVQLDKLDKSEWPATDQLPNLNKFLSYGNVIEIDENNIKRSLEARMLELFGVSQQSDDIPVAHFRAKYYQHSDEYLWCLDPVHIQIDMDEAILIANDELKLTENEARLLIQDLNDHFQQDEFHIQYCSPSKWILKANFDISTNTLSNVLCKSINENQPDGKDKTRWQKILNEIQMLLHNHPINLARESQGRMTINSLWLWGKGKYNSLETSIQLTCSDHELVAYVASLSNITHELLPVKLMPERFANRISLIILTEQLHSIIYKDVFEWFEFLQRFDSNILAPLISMLEDGLLEQVSLHSDTIEIRLAKKNLPGRFFAFMNRNDTLRKNLLRLREQYGL